jgi:hypothetical protein
MVAAFRCAGVSDTAGAGAFGSESNSASNAIADGSDAARCENNAAIFSMRVPGESAVAKPAVRAMCWMTG